MANLGPLYQNQTYGNLLQVDGGLTAELKPVLDGDGNASGLTLSLTGVGISGLVADSASNLYAGTAGALPYQVNTNVTGFVTAGTPGQFLLSNGASAPVWTTVTPSTIGALASNGSNSMTGNLSMGSNKIVNLLTPVSDTDAATKAYVDSIATGLQVKAACRLATTTNLTTLTGAATVDGVVVNTGDRVLVRAQTNPAENGIYVANVSTSPLGVWTRATDADTWAEIVGAATFITAGSTLANTTWVSNVAPGGTLDTTPITFVLFGASTAYTAGTGLSLVGSQFSLTTPVSLANGGTGATTLTGYVKGNGTSAMTAVASIPNTDVSGLGTLSTQNANAVTLTGGTINGTSVGATTASTGAFTDLAASGAVNFSNYINVDPLTAAYFTAPRVWDSSKTHWYRITPSELAADRYVTLPLLGNNDTFVFENHAQTLTNKTLTSPVINGGSISTTTTQTNWDAAYADRLKWDGGSAGLSAPTGRSSLGLGNIATINTTGSTTNFLRADGTWAAPASGGGQFINVMDYGAVANNSTDNHTAFTNAINAAIAAKKPLFIPGGQYVIGSQIYVTTPVDIYSDMTAALRFTNTASCGFWFDFGGNPSACSIRLPLLAGPGLNSSFQYPGYPTSWTGSSRYGTALRLTGGYCHKVFVNWVNAWNIGVLYETANVSGVTAGNIDITIGNIDLCTYGVYLKSAVGTTGIAGMAIVANTIFAKYPIYCEATYNISDITMSCSSMFANEIGGAVIYASGTELKNSTFYLNAVVAGYWGDSPIGTTNGVVVPYISGDGTQNGETGFFRCGLNKISIQPSNTQPSWSGCTLIPVAGRAIRIKDAGTNNQISTVFDYVTTTPIALSSSASEASYNGGVGGAQYSKFVYSTYTLASSLAVGAGVGAYLFHQLAPSGSAINRPVKITDAAGTIVQNGIVAYAFVDTVTSTRNRQINVFFTNKGSATVAAGTTFYFWVEVD